MKFLHLADCHLDAPCVELGQTLNKSDVRRHELRESFSRAIKFAKSQNVDVLLISGDLFEQQYVDKSTIVFINDEFKKIPGVRVFISPGNHDPFIQNSYYNTFEWFENVHIFKDEFEKVYIEQLQTNIWGVGFADFYVNKCLVKNIQIEDGRINILITHGTVDTFSNECKYHPLQSNYLANMGFNYCALGHIHKNCSDEKNKIFYPGSLEPLGFDETGEHGFIMGEITKDYNNVNFYPISLREYINLEIDVTGLTKYEEILEKIRSAADAEKSKDNFYRIILVGKVEDTIIDCLAMQEFLRDDFYFIKIEDKTEIPYSFGEIEKEYSLKGLFAKKMNNLIQKAGPEDKDMLIKALHYGLDALTKGEVKI